MMFDGGTILYKAQVQVQAQVPNLGTYTSINAQGLRLRDVGRDWGMVRG